MKKTHNAGNIYNKNHKSTGIFFIEDVKKNGSITSKIKDNNTLLVNIEPNSISEPVLVHVEITASTLSNYFSDTAFINRSGIDTLSLIPKSSLTLTDNLAIANVKKIDAWDKIFTTYSNNEKWANTESLENQFACHYDFAKKKDSWNLEPYRPNVGYFATVLAACNP
ncbi:DUF2599 domain-containing protein [Bacillus sp. FJAT-22090]|uniref:DUF2599 domain-containing protein n=1 Tax=Bacillus sp. FJAT-22090 TaxID=1581038 RepID=UPI0016430358|nr:DUF2599 domain-containing protein [Bacillus sp. FJAT-22090]